MNTHSSQEKIHFFAGLQFSLLSLTLAAINIAKEVSDPDILTFRNVTLGTVIVTFIGAMYHCYKGMKTLDLPDNRSSFFHHNPIIDQLPGEVPLIVPINSPAA